MIIELEGSTTDIVQTVFSNPGKALDMEEAVARMQRRGKQSVRWTLKGITIEWKYIPATEARNYDGSSAGHGQDSNKIILQRMVWREGKDPRYTNWW